MKKLLLVVLAAVGLASCVQNEELAVSNDKSAIAFDTFVENATKASAYDNTTLNKFYVYGTISQNGTVVTNIFDGVEVSNETGVWAYGPQYTQYWIPGFRYDFAAVVDGTVVTNSNNMPESIEVDMTEQEDVLYATAGRDFGANEVAAKVSFTFDHLLAKAKFTVKNTISAGQNFVYNVESIKIKNADKNGAYDVATGVWAATNTYEADFGVAAALAIGSQPVSGSEVYLLPNANKDLDIEVVYNLTYNNGTNNPTLKSETKTLAAVLNIEQGKAYNFVVEFGNPGEEIEFEAIVNDWANGSVEVFQGVSVPVTTAQELIDAIADPEVGEAVLMNDIDLTSTITRSGEESTPVIAKSFVIDGNDKKLKYSGSNRVIDITYNEGENDNLVVTIKNLTINITSTYCQRGINYNAGGLLIIDKVKFEGKAPTYAVNCPGSSDNAVVKIKNSEVIGNIALNLWGENMKVDVTDSILTSVDTASHEDYSAVTLNNDGTTMANGTVVNIKGGKVIARDENDEPSYAVKNNSLTGEVNIDKTTEVVGKIEQNVAIVYFDGANEFYGSVSLAEAVETYLKNANASGIRLIRDVELEETLVIPAGKPVVLDLNGKTISQEKSCTASYEMIANNGELTIMGNGKISFKDTGAGDPTHGWGSYTIRNSGTLVVEDGVIEHLGNQDFATHMICAIFQYSGSTTINGGVISTPNYRSARLWKGSMTINGGEFNGQLWVQAVDNSAELTVNGGSFAPVGRDGSSIFVTNNEYTVNLAVNGGYFNTKIGTSVPSKDGVKGAIKGGSFTESAKENTNAALLAEGYSFVEENGVWTVKDNTPYATDAESLQTLLAEGGDIVLANDITLAETLEIAAGKEVSLNLNGKTITAPEANGYVVNNVGGKLTIEGDGVINGVVYTEGSQTIINGGTFNALNGGAYVLLNSQGTLTINKATINGGTSYPVYSYNAGNKLVINDATINATFGCVNSYGLGGVVEINGGTFQMTGVQGKTSHIAYFSNIDATINGGTFKKTGDISMSATGGGGVCVINGANLTINGGTFAGDHADVYNWSGTNANGRPAGFTINGGSFKFKPSNVAEGHAATQNGNGTWTVE